MSTTLDNEGGQPVIRPIWFAWLDIDGDPLFAHTGIGTIAFSEGETGDPALDGKTFTGIGIPSQIGEIHESENGSDAVRLTLPGIDPELPGFGPLLADADQWQYRRAILWFSYLNAECTGLIDYPERVKTGRLDNLVVDQGEDTCAIRIDIEGYAANTAPALGTKYSEQTDIDDSDTSQDYVADLANRQPEIGPGSTSSTTSGASQGGGGTDPSTYNQAYRGYGY